MIHRLPAWVWCGASLLSGIAGMINAVGLLGISHQGITHLTGIASRVGIAASEGDWSQAGHFGLFVAVFVFGAAISSLIIHSVELQLGHRYGYALIVESLLLVIATFLLQRQIQSAVYLLSMAAGLQNAMASQYSGAIVRTTHVTGIFTDIGIEIGNVLRGNRIARRKISLLVIIGVSFIFGGFVGAIGFSQVGYKVLWLPTMLTGIGGGLYLTIRLLYGHLYHKQITDRLR